MAVGTVQAPNPFDLPVAARPAPVTALPRPSEAHYRLNRNLVLLLAINATSVTLLVHAHWPGRPTMVAAAFGIAALLSTNAVLAFKNGDRAVPWFLLMGSLVLSRHLLTIGAGNVFGVRDASTHIFGVTWGILGDGHIPEGIQYSEYPFIHILLAAAKLVTGLDLWVTATILATLLALLTAVLVLLIARTWFQGSHYLAGVIFLAFPLSVAMGFLYQPLTVSMALFAAMTYLVVRRNPFPLGRSLFLVLSVALTLTHPYSATVLGMALFLATIGTTAMTKKVGYLGVAFVGALFTFLYSTFIGLDFEYFVSLFQYRFGTPAAQREFAVGPKPLSTFSNSLFFILWNQFANWVILLPAVAGWVLLLRGQRWRPASIHWIAVTLGVLYAAGLFLAFLLPYRTLALAVVVIAPFAGWALFRAPRWVVGVILPIILVSSLTSADVTLHYFPWDEGNLVSHPLENDVSALATMLYVYELELSTPDPGTVVSSHPVFYEDFTLDARTFSGDNKASGPNATYFVYRTDSAKYGFSTGPSSADSDVVFSTYEPYPTDEHLALLRSIHRVGAFGPYQVYRI